MTLVLLSIFLQDRKPFSEEAQKIVIAASNAEFVGVLTAKSITDIFYILRKSLHSESKARKNLHKLFSLFEVTDTFSIDCRLALGSDTKDYEDAVMLETARRIGVECIVTRNIKDYVNSTVLIYSPKEFI